MHRGAQPPRVAGTGKTMHFDLPTLMAAGSFVAAMSAVFVFFAWTHIRDGREMLWWALGYAFYAVGVGLLTVGTVEGPELAIALGAIVFNIAPALFWMSSRLFNRRRVPLVPLFGGLALGLLIMGFSPLALRPSLQMALGLAIFAAYTLATTWEYWRGRHDGLKARQPLIALGLLQAALFGAGSVEAATGRISAGDIPLESWFGLVHFVSILYLIGTAVFVVSLSRERAERHQKATAETDALTGVANRGAFMAYAGEALRRSLQGDLPLSMIIFDLDYFKRINDSFGHAVGDGVLRRFGETARSVLREDDRLGRIGGEEFAVILPDTSLGSAFIIADRIRAAFEGDGRFVDGHAVNATVSAGVTTAHPDSTVDSILAAADEGLYRAKQNGRNRVERRRAGRDGDGGPYLEIVA